MPDVQHALLRPGVASGIHVVHAWEVFDEAARLALSVTTDDEGKIARQLSDNTYWLLRTTSGGAAWQQVGGGGTLTYGSPVAVGTSNEDGTGSAVARATHVHAHGNQAGGSLHANATTSASGFLSAADKTKLDSVAANANVGPAVPTATPADLSDSAPAIGTTGKYATEGHVHAHGARGGGSLHAVATTGAAGFMSAADKTKLDGLPEGGLSGPAVPTVAPQELSDSTSAIGATGKYATEGHVHAHGTRGGGTLHAVATTGAAGFLSAADKTKLDGIASGATNTAAPPNAPSAAPPELADSTGAVGTPGTYAAEGHTHAHGNRGGGALHAVATTGAAGFMSAADKTKLDGVAANATVGPGVATVAPADLSDSAPAIGTAGKYATEGHVHAHGNRGGGALHAVATTGAAGFLSAADKTKLDGIAANANVGPTVPTVAPLALTDYAASIGTTGKYATEGHVHPHGDRGGGNLHTPATTVAAGFMSAADKLRLDNIDYFQYVTNNAANLTLAATHHSKTIVCTYTAGVPTITIPRDSTLNLPIGFNCYVLYAPAAVSENAVKIVSEVMTGTYGTPTRNAIAYSNYGTTPYELWVPWMYKVLVEKLAADSWLISGAYVAAA